MSTSPRRHIKLRLTQRSASDEPKILHNIADAFKDDNIEIHVSDIQQQESAPPEIETGFKGVKDALELQDQLVRGGIEVVDAPEEAERKTRHWMRNLSIEGFKITAQVIMREVLSRVIDAVGE